MSTLAFASGTFTSIYNALLSHSPHAIPTKSKTKLSSQSSASPCTSSSKPFYPHLTDAISSLYLHPTLEAALHILNNDLPSAHFLVRHMEAAPAFEAMFLHAILHRVEGDYANTKAWYTSVAKDEASLETGAQDGALAGSEIHAETRPGSQSGIFAAVWESSIRGFEYLASVEDFVKFGSGNRGELEGQGRAEIERTVDYLRGKFGDGRWQNAASEWRYADGDTKVIKEKMILGGMGYRVF